MIVTALAWNAAVAPFRKLPLLILLFSRDPVIPRLDRHWFIHFAVLIFFVSNMS